MNIEMIFVDGSELQSSTFGYQDSPGIHPAKNYNSDGSNPSKT